jgi:LysM repeat protein
MTLRWLLALVLAAPMFDAAAQTTRTINGRKFEVHVAQAGQTLYAIARTYAVPVDILLATNPTANDGLSIGEEVLIPADAVVKKEKRTAPTLRNDGELLHTVRKKETLFGIARSYGLDMNALLERNPDAISLKEGMELVIPLERVSGAPSVTLTPARPADMLEHVVQQGETLFGLSQRYGVDTETIRKANGGLPDGLKAGATLFIPGGHVAAEVVEPTTRVREDVRYKVAFLLPFAIARNDSVLAKASADERPAFYEPTRIAAQFYNGALLALDSLKKLDLHADVEVIDLGDDVKTWNKALRDPGIQEFDLFLGPFHRTAIEQLARINTHAHIVCPVPQSNKVILGMPTVSKVTPTRSDLVKHAARYVATHHARENIILLRPDIATEKDMQEQAHTALNEALATRSERLRDTVLTARPGRRELGDLAGKLDAARLNVIVSPSDDVEFVTTLVGKLKPLATKYRIQLVGMEAWKDMASVAATDLDLLAFTFAASSFADPLDARLRTFTHAYRDRFKTDVDDYALLGFDVTFYYLKALLAEGLTFPDHFSEVHTEPLHMGFRMTRTGPENGFRNEFAIMLQQKDLLLQKAP